MRIHSTIQDSIVDGPGLRYVVFVQGCSHNCRGCHNPATHDYDGGRDAAVEDLVAEMRQNPLCEGLTLSGGEPFDQAWECSLLASRARIEGKTVWTYTGYGLDYILRQARRSVPWALLLHHTNVLVDGPFVESLKSYDAKFRGSTNQRLIDVPKSLEAGEVVLWEPEEQDLGHFEVPES